MINLKKRYNLNKVHKHTGIIYRIELQNPSVYISDYNKNFTLLQKLIKYLRGQYGRNK